MISLTPIDAAAVEPHASSDELDLYLGRAQQESIAAVRATDDRAAASHCVMAAHYSARAVAMLEAKAA